MLPCYDSDIQVLISDNISSINGFEAKFNGKQLSSLYLLNFSFWNNGRETIKREYLTEIDHLRLSALNGFSFLDAELTYQSKSSINANYKFICNNREMHLDFDHLCNKEGFIYKVYLTNENDTKENTLLQLNGDIIGANEITHKDNLKKTKIDIIIESSLKKLLPKMLKNKYDNILLDSISNILSIPFFIIALAILVIISPVKMLFYIFSLLDKSSKTVPRCFNLEELNNKTGF